MGFFLYIYIFYIEKKFESISVDKYECSQTSIGIITEKINFSVTRVFPSIIDRTFRNSGKKKAKIIIILGSQHVKTARSAVIIKEQRNYLVTMQTPPGASYLA